MHVRCITVGVFQVNTWLVTHPETGQSVVIDTGESDELVRRLSALDADVRAILLTHTHLDHAGALTLLQERWPEATTIMPAADRPLFETLPMQGTMFGMPHLDRPCGRIDREIADGDTVEVAGMKFRFLSTPGHTPGQGCFEADGHIFVGDTLFAGGIGRTDFPLSDPALMVESLRRLTRRDGALIVHSGHGPDTTIAAELATNPFLGYIRRERGIAGPPGVRWAAGT